MKKDFLNENLSIKLMLFGILLLIISIFLFFWKVDGLSLNTPINTEKFNHFGSFIAGIIGTLWSMAGVILFYVALKEQRKDFKTNQDALNAQLKSLNQQIKEYELQRKELELTRNVFIEQSKTLKTQQFESTFFNTFNLLTGVTQNINNSKPQNLFVKLTGASDNKEVYFGKNCFEFFYYELEYTFRIVLGEFIANNSFKFNIPDEDFNLPIEIHEQLVQNSYKKVFEKHQADLGHYFRTLYNIFKLVKNQNPENSNYYTNLVLSQLSTYEHLLLFYNCLSEYGEERFKPLIIEFSLLDNMPVEKLLDELHKDFYPEKAYK